MNDRSPLQDLFWSLPALLMFAAIITVVSLGSDAAQTAKRYQNIAEGAYRREDYDWALLCYRKAETFEALGAELGYRKALCLVALDRRREAADVMEKLAGDPDFYNPARIWLVQEIVRKPRLSDEDLPALAKAEEDIDDVLKSLPDPLQERRVTAATNQALEAYDAAWKIKRLRKGPAASIYYLKRLAPFSPPLRLELAMAYAAIGNQEEATQEAQLVRQQAEDALKLKPADLLNRRIAIKGACLARDFGAALKLVDDGMRESGIVQELVLERVVVLNMWAEELLKAPEPKLEQVLEILFIAARQMPAFRPTYGTLARLSLRQGVGGQQAKDALLAALARGKAPEMVHALLGDLAWGEGNIEQARQHWQLSLAIDPSSIVIMNNLAMALADVPQPRETDLQLALSLVEQALARQELPQLYDTQALILFQMKKYREALVPFNKALTGLPDNWQVRLLGSRIYDALGMKEEANRFQGEAEKLRFDLQRAARNKEQGKDQTAEQPKDGKGPEAKGPDAKGPGTKAKEGAKSPDKIEGNSQGETSKKGEAGNANAQPAKAGT